MSRFLLYPLCMMGILLFGLGLLVWDGRALEAVYWHGPSCGGYGFWNGKDPADICAQLTEIPASHWIQNMSVCKTKLYVQFTSFRITVGIILFLCVFGILFNMTMAMFVQSYQTMQMAAIYQQMALASRPLPPPSVSPTPSTSPTSETRPALPVPIVQEMI